MIQPVVVHQHFDEVLEEVRLAGTEEASWDLVYCLFQLREFVVVWQGIIASNTRHLQNTVTVATVLLTFNIYVIVSLVC